MFNRHMMLHFAVTALLFFVAFRFLSFIGLPLVLLIALGVGGWYLFTKKPELVAEWKQKIKARVPEAPKPRKPRPKSERPLNSRERRAFDDLERNFRSEDTGEGRSTRS